MKVSYNWLNSFFDDSLPPAEEVMHALTFHSWEVEDEEEKGKDMVFDVKVLPDKSAWGLSHRGIAKDLGVVLEKTLARDPLAEELKEPKSANSLAVSIADPRCARYQAAVVLGVAVGPSPAWLKEKLEAIGQRSINNIVDATNYVMFDMGQPLHAFDADKLGETDGKHHIAVRAGKEGEHITTLTNDEYELTPAELLIVDGANDEPIGLAGIKGGKRAEVDERTTNIIIEAANFDPVATRKASQRLKLRTDASQRFENGILPALTACALKEVVALIIKIAGGREEGVAETAFIPSSPVPVSVSIEKLNRVLGITLDEKAVGGIMDRFGYAYLLEGDTLTVTPPFERPDLVIPEDVIEEVGRIYGYEHVPSRTPEPLQLTEFNKRFYYSEKIRELLVSRGFSEVYTSSFRERDTVKMKNAFASDKGCLRSSLRENMNEALKRNVPNKDLLGLPHIALFEIGTVFGEGDETFALALGVRHGMDHKPKTDDPILTEATDALEDALGITLEFSIKDGIAELDFGALLPSLPDPTVYEERPLHGDVAYQPFSPYPAISRDIALWVGEGVSAEDAEQVLNDNAGDMRMRTTLFDEFSKDGRTSYAFRLVFQSNEKTLTDSEVNAIMDDITAAVSERDWEVR